MPARQKEEDADEKNAMPKQGRVTRERKQKYENKEVVDTGCLGIGWQDLYTPKEEKPTREKAACPATSTDVFNFKNNFNATSFVRDGQLIFLVSQEYEEILRGGRGGGSF